MVNNTSYKVIDKYNFAQRCVFSRCWRCLEGCLPFPGQTQKIPTTTQPMESSLWYGRLTLLQGRWFMGELRRLPTKFLIRRWLYLEMIFRWFFSMIKMTEVQVSATNSYIPKGGGRGSFLWYSLMKTLTPQAIYFPIPPARNHQILGWKQLALSLSLQETVDLPKLKMLSSTEKNSSQKYIGCF